MPYVHLVIALALLEFMLFGVAVARARVRYNVPAPATGGHAVFERYFRVQMNTLELLVVLIPALPLFAWYVSPRWAAGLGGVYLVGRFLYFFTYLKDPATRSAGFGLSFLPIVALLLGGIGGAIAALLKS